jgi:signal transduction histidine kinase
VRALAVEFVCIAVLVMVPVRGATLRVLSAFFPALLLFAMGSALGSLGDRGEPWLANAWLGVVPSAFIPLRFGPRVLATTCIAAALPAGFFLPHMDVAGTVPTALGQLSFGGFAVVFTVVAGEIWYRVTRTAFFERRALDVANGQLAAMTDSLSELVRERTRELQELARHLSEVQEAERRQIARDLHDDLGQTLTAMRYTVARLEARIGAASSGRGRPEDAEVEALVEDLSALLDGTATTIRDVVSMLRPRILDDLGAEAAAEWLCERVATTAGVRCALSTEQAEASAGVDGWTDLSPEARLVAFRALQEATTNALKHGAAEVIDVSLRLTPDAVELQVADDGAGFDPSAPTVGFGLLGLRERVRDAGGALSVTSQPGAGTRVAVTLPRRPWVATGDL